MQEIKVFARGNAARAVNGPSVIVPEQAYYTHNYGLLDFFRPSIHRVGERFWHKDSLYEVVENHLMRGDAETASVHRFKAVQVEVPTGEKAFTNQVKAWALSHQHGSARVSEGVAQRPSLTFFFNERERKVYLIYLPGRSVHQLDLKEVYNLLVTAVHQGWEVKVGHDELRRRLRELDTEQAYSAAHAALDFNFDTSGYGERYGLLIKKYTQAAAALENHFHHENGGTPRWHGYMSRNLDALQKPAIEFVELVKASHKLSLPY